LETVERSTTSKTEKEIVHVIMAGKVGAPATKDRKRRKLRMLVKKIVKRRKSG
jgi:hypothetical protein